MLRLRKLRFGSGKMKKKTTTIIDVARATGVSPSTVSHALSGKRVISAPVKKRIFDKIKELDYRPSFYAQALKNNSTRLIGVVVNECRNPSAASYLDCLAEKLEKFSYKPVVAITGLNHEKGVEMLRRLSTGMVDGIINLLPQIDPVEAEQLCGAVPVVTNLREPAFPVHLDYDRLTRDILDCLWKNGHRDIGYITSRTRLFGSMDTTIQVMRKFLEEHGVAFDPGLVVMGDDTIESSIAAMETIYPHRKVTAVFTGNDQMAFGVYRWAYNHGLTIPNELSVVGFDNVPQAATIIPPLTTASFPYSEIIDHTVRLLMTKLERRPVASGKMILEMPLVIRHSVADISQTRKKGN